MKIQFKFYFQNESVDDHLSNIPFNLLEDTLDQILYLEFALQLACSSPAAVGCVQL